MKAIKRLSKTLTAQGIGRAAAKSGAIAAVKGVKPTAKSVFKPSAARAAAGALKRAEPKGALTGAIAAVKGVKPTAKSVFKPSAARAAAGALKRAEPKGALKGEERKFYKMTGHTGMKMTKLPRRSK